MSKQLPSSPSSKKISDLVGMIRRGELILQPEFQRKLVWNPSHKEAFIDTILSGYPFPEIYIAQSGIDVETLQSQQVVVDGQQRLTTIMQYINENNPDFGKKVPKYKDLEQKAKEDFLNYNVVIRDLQDVEPNTIKEVFRRINQTKFNLEQIEIQNAIYDGEFITTAKEILDDFPINQLPVFNDIEISRMGDLNFILLAMATYEEGGYFVGNKNTEDYIVRFNDNYENKEHIKGVFSSIINHICELELPNDSIWFRKSNFLTLLMELIWKEDITPNLKEKLVLFESNITQNKGDKSNDFGIYYSYMYTGTNSRNARVERGRIFREQVF